ncbi:MAG: AAA family ATPase [Candidatus Odinarchaeia archaeon]
MIKLTPKLVRNVTKEIHQELQDLKRTQFQKFFHKKKVVRLEQQVSQFNYYNMSINLETYLKNNKVVVKQLKSIFDEERILIYEPIKVDANNTVYAMTEGTYLCTYHNKKFALKFFTLRPDYYVAIYCDIREANFFRQWFLNFIKWSKENHYLKNKKFDLRLQFLPSSNLTFNDLIIPFKVKQQLISNIFKYSTVFNEYHIKRGLLLYGPPGTGKTLTGKILANTWKGTFIWITPEQLQCLGSLKSIYELAEICNPTLIFLEDLDLIAEDRYHVNSKKMLGELMNVLDGIRAYKNIITIATSNKVKDIEKAVSNRPGRFDILIKFDLPDIDTRKRIFEYYFKQFKIKPIITPKILNNSESLTPAHIREAIIRSLISVNGSKNLINEEVLLTNVEKVKNLELKSSRRIGFNPNEPLRHNESYGL